MNQQLIRQLSKHLNLNKHQIESLLETPPSPELGDYAFPCFALSKQLKKSPNQIAEDLSKQLKLKEFQTKPTGPYLNFFIDSNTLAKQTIKQIQKEKNNYGSAKIGKNKTVVIDMSSPNIAKPFGIGHLRSTIIGNSISKIFEFTGYKPIKINYLGDWGTPFGKIIAGYKEFGNASKLKTEPVKHLYEIYTKVSKDKKYEELGREYFKKLEQGDKEIIKLWKTFRELSIKDFNKVYNLLGIKFDVTSGESEYNNKMQPTVRELKKKGLLEESQGAKIVNLEKYKLGVALIQKQDGTTLYATRDLTAAITRKKKYNAEFLLYEVGAEQKHYFNQLFKILELLGYKWSKNCFHVDHGLYLDKDGKKLATRKGKTVFMEDVLNETIELASKELKKREKLSEAEIKKRALAITRAAIIYGDLKNFRSNDMVFNINKFLEFEGNTGPYLLYTYARARSILRKSSKKPKNNPKEISNSEKQLLLNLSKFSETVLDAKANFTPHTIATYAHTISKSFNEFYHANKVLDSDQEEFRLVLVESFSQVLKNALSLLGIAPLEVM